MNFRKTIGLLAAIACLPNALALASTVPDIDLSKAQCIGNARDISLFFPAGMKLQANPEMTQFLLSTRDGYIKNPIMQVYSDDSQGSIGGAIAGFGVGIGEENAGDTEGDGITHVIASFATVKLRGFAYAAHGGSYESYSRVFKTQSFQCVFPR